MKYDLEKLRQITVLYVEDEQMIRTQTIGILENLFKKIYIGVDGEDGVKLFESHQNEIDIIVTDINMPKKNGLELAEEVHQIKPKLPIILTTAFTDEEFLLKSLELDIHKYLTKPLKIKELTNTISLAVDQYKKKLHQEKATKLLASKTAQMSKEIEQMGTEADLSTHRLNFYENIVDTHISNFQMDKNGYIQKASTKFCTLFGYEKEEIIGKTLSSISNQASLFQKNMLVAARDNKPVHFQKVFLSKAGNDILLDTTIYPQKGQDGLILAYHCYQNIIL